MAKKEITALTELVFASLIGMVALAIILPNIAPEITAENHVAYAHDRVAVAGYSVFVLSTIFCIFIGAKRWFALRILGWAVLLVFTAAALQII